MRNPAIDKKFPGMIRIRALFAASFLTALAGLPAWAGSSDWHHVEGGSLRLVTGSAAEPGGLLRGALEIRLRPGWKTYWMDPGSSGVPPTLEAVAGGRPVAVDIAFPAPQRFDDGYGEWAGYDHSVVLALTFRLPKGEDVPDMLEASAFLGLCETICIPVKADFVVEKQGAEDADAHDTIVAAAFGALPDPARPGFEATIVARAGGALEIEVSAPADARVLDIHIAGDSRHTFGEPVRHEQDGRTTFSLPVLGKQKPSADAQFPYTLVTSSGAVSGVLRLP